MKLETPLLSDKEKTRFYKHLRLSPDSDCWSWNSGCSMMNVAGIRHRSNRLMFRLFNPLDPEQLLTHTCGNPLCLNPEHLEIKL